MCTKMNAVLTERIMRGRSLAYWALVVAVAAAYFGAAKLGLTMALVAEQVTAVWPPTGIALAALVLFGNRLWPGIALGALLANLTAHEPLASACGIALGNTLEAVLGAYLLRRFVEFRASLARIKDVFGLIGLAAKFDKAAKQVSPQDSLQRVSQGD